MLPSGDPERIRCLGAGEESPWTRGPPLTGMGGKCWGHRFPDSQSWETAMGVPDLIDPKMSHEYCSSLESSMGHLVSAGAGVPEPGSPHWLGCAESAGAPQFDSQTQEMTMEGVQEASTHRMSHLIQEAPMSMPWIQLPVPSLVSESQILFPSNTVHIGHRHLGNFPRVQDGDLPCKSNF